MKTGASDGAATKAVGFWEAFRLWVKLGFVNFGGSADQIAIMHRELVERKRWVSEGQYLRTLNFCMLLPGPEAQQVATYIGWWLHGVLGGIVAGSFFVLPSISVLWLLSCLVAAHSDVPAVTGLLYGVQARGHSRGGRGGLEDLEAHPQPRLARGFRGRGVRRPVSLLRTVPAGSRGSCFGRVGLEPCGTGRVPGRRGRTSPPSTGPVARGVLRRCAT